MSTPQSSSCVCYALNHYRHYSTQIIHTQHLRGLQKFRGWGHSSAQLWQITINSLLQIFHIFTGNVVLWGTLTPYSQQSQQLSEGYLKKMPFPISIRTKKTLQQLWANAVPTSLSTAAGHLQAWGCAGRTSMMHHRILSRWHVNSVLRTSISFLLLF